MRELRSRDLTTRELRLKELQSQSHSAAETRDLLDEQKEARSRELRLRSQEVRARRDEEAMHAALAAVRAFLATRQLLDGAQYLCGHPLRSGGVAHEVALQIRIAAPQEETLSIAPGISPGEIHQLGQRIGCC